MVMKRAAQIAEASETRTIAAGEFKAKCLQLMDEVNEKKLTLIVTKRGKPVMRAEAVEKPFRSVIGRTPNIKILGDIMTPLRWDDPIEKWERVNRAHKPGKAK
jgi:antitoxin (DNA-binding transcriptional repressor) of toxin-antitoxin stability system